MAEKPVSLTRAIIGGTPLLGQLTGIGHYTRQLVTALQAHELLAELKLWADVSFIDSDVASPPSVGNDSDEPIEISQPVFAAVKRSIRARAARSYAASWVYSRITDRVAAARLAPYAQTHLYHSPNFILPRYEGPKVVTIHDLSVLRFPEFHRRPMVELCERGIHRAVAEGAQIITDAQLVRKEVINQFGLPGDRVTAVHLAPDVRCRPRSAMECRSVLANFGLTYRSFYLCVGTIEPRKNLLRTFEAYRAGRQAGLFEWPLVVVGAPGWKSAREHEALDALCADGLAVYLRYLDDTSLHQLYSATGLLVFPSLYEGFGLPAIEAQASGSRVLISRGSTMAEFANSSALLVDPEDTDAIRSGLHEGYAHLQSTVTDKASRTWEQVAIETAAVYYKTHA